MVPRLRAWIPRDDLVAGVRFLRRLPGYLRHPVGFEEARSILRRRLERREADFLSLLKHAVYDFVASPYRRLLAMAGCEYGDLEKLVTQDGVEGALGTLFRHGVYLTIDEVKGKRPAVRGGVAIAVNPGRLRNPGSAMHIPTRTSGSRGSGTPVGIDLACLRDAAANFCAVYEAQGGVGWRHAVWSVPGGAAMNQILRFSGFGAYPGHWFSQIDPAAPSLHPRYRWSARVMRWGSLMAGIPLPIPIHVSLEDPLPIVHWMAGVLRAGGTPHLSTFASSAVRLCQAARVAGVDLRGAQFTMSGEPTTAARLAAVRRDGVGALPQYGSSEAGGTIAHGCLAPDAPDDMHFFHDLRAVIQPGPDGPVHGLRPTTLLFTSLRPTAPLILLNVSLGDQASLDRHACGCPLERLGWTTHLHTVRSAEKLTTGGMSFLDLDLIPALEEVLPTRFGGGPTDYQLMEEDSIDGHPQLTLLVHPAIGPLDPRAVREAFLNAIGPGRGAERVMALLWWDSGFLRVERRSPVFTPGGKILHLGALSGGPAPPGGLGTDDRV